MKTFQQRFDEKYARDPASECWIWQGASLRAGYGLIADDSGTGNAIMATHASLILAGRPSPEAGLFALHTCDNPPCVNPDHLFWGTCADNVSDMMSKGRHSRQGQTHCKKGHEYTPENMRFEVSKNRRVCRTCERAAGKRKYENGPGKGRWGPRPFCKHGHALTAENVYVRKDGKGRQCKTCALQAGRSRFSRPARIAMDELNDSLENVPW